jgi:hypothetical protein
MATVASTKIGISEVPNAHDPVQSLLKGRFRTRDRWGLEFTEKACNQMSHFVKDSPLGDLPRLKYVIGLASRGA